ncbi:hypothetical protein D3C73_1476370 [compost metagenome]
MAFSVLTGSDASEASIALIFAMDCRACFSMLWASGATCLSSRFISLDVLASVVRRSSPILSNGIFSILATILLTCCCN